MARLTNKELEEQLEAAQRQLEVFKKNELLNDEEILEKLAEAEKENETLKDELLKAKAVNHTDATSSSQDNKSIQEYLNERVPFKAFKDDSKYKDDFSVTVNGKIYVIQRGVTVMIPRYVLLAIEDAEVQRANAANTSQKYENLYVDKQDKF